MNSHSGSAALLLAVCAVALVYDNHPGADICFPLVNAGFPEGRLLRDLSFNMLTPGFQDILRKYRYAQIPLAVRIERCLCE